MQDDNKKNLGFSDFLTVDYKNDGDDLISYQAHKRHRGVVGESMDPRDFTDKPGYLVVVSKPSGKKMIKQYAPTSQAAKKYADRINKTNKVGHKATVHKTDGRKIMREEVEVDEELSRVQRMKASQRMKRYSKKIARAKERALRRAPSMDVLQKRAKKQARNQMIKKWTRGQDKSDLAVGRKSELEKRLKKMAPKLDRLAKRMMPQLRKADRERRSGAGSSKKD
jgi:hypothetical protein